MNISQIIVYIMVIFMLLGGADRIIGNKFGLGTQFEEGFNAMGPLALGMIGITCLAPLLGDILTPSIGPFFKLFGADPAMAGSIILSIDTGGYALSHSMTDNVQIANYSSIILASMMGPTLAFGIPVALSIIEKKDTKFLALGTLAGIIVIPFACVIGGLIAGYGLALSVINMIPIFIVAILIAVGLALIPNGMIKGFQVFSVLMTAIITLSLAHAIVSELTGITLIQGMAPLEESYVIIGGIAIMLAGAYPMVHIITKVLAKPLSNVGKFIGVNEVAVAGFIATLANSIPTYGMIKDMDNKGKVLNFAFICCAAFALGDHLGFCAAAEPDLVFPMVACKILGGILCIVAAIFVCKLQGDKLNQTDPPKKAEPQEAAAT